MRRGVLIAIEGVDGSGKATQSKILTEALGAKLYSFPRYETAIGCTILGNLKGEWHCEAWNNVTGSAGFKTEVNALVLQSLMALDRYDAAGEIESLLSAGTNVVCDRYWASGYVYGAADDLDRAWLERVHACLPKPDVWILLDVAPEDSVARRPERRDRYERDEKMGLRREIYLELFRERAQRGEPWRMVDGRGSVQDVAREVTRMVVALCGRDAFGYKEENR